MGTKVLSLIEACIIVTHDEIGYATQARIEEFTNHAHQHNLALPMWAFQAVLSFNLLSDRRSDKRCMDKKNGDPVMRTTRFSLASLNVPAPSSAHTGMLVRIYPEPGVGQVFELTAAQLLIGRDQADVDLPDDSVSPQHATIGWNGQAHVLGDLDSLHGSYVNEDRIQSRVLRNNDSLRIGNQRLQYLAPGYNATQLSQLSYKLNTTDGLTDAHNRLYLLESFRRELHMAQRSTAPLAIMLLEVDNFESIQANYGHMTGDHVLVDVADRVQHIVRRGDLFARFGPDQFALLCSQTHLQDALSLAERIRLAASSRPVFDQSRTVPTSVSIGVAEFSASRSDEPNSFDADSLCTVLLAEASQYLQLAHRQGNNQVVSCASVACGAR